MYAIPPKMIALLSHCSVVMSDLYMPDSVIWCTVKGLGVGEGGEGTGVGEGGEGGDWVERGVTEEVREAFPKSYIHASVHDKTSLKQL